MSTKTLTPTMERRLFLLLRYMQALSAGDLETIDKILSIARHDDVLERMLIETNMLDQAEQTDLLEQTETERQPVASRVPGGIREQDTDSLSTIASVRPPVSKRKGWRLKKSFNMLAAVLVVSVLLGGFLSLTVYGRMHSTSSGAQLQSPPTHAPTSSWHIVQPASDNSFVSSTFHILATAGNDAWAISGQSTSDTEVLEHWNGQKWNVVTLPGIQAFEMTGLAATSAHDAWLVGSYKRDSSGKASILIEHWDGHRWELRDEGNLPVHGEFYAVTAVASDDVWAVGDSISATKDASSLIAHWNGQQWEMVTHPMQESEGRNGMLGIGFTSITALSAGDIWAIGNVSTNQPNAYAANEIHPLVEHWNGHQWSVAQLPDSGGLFEDLSAITALSPNDVWIVGSTAKSMSAEGNSISKGLIEHWNGVQWSVVTSIQVSQGLNLNGIVALSPTDIWAVGSGVATSSILTAKTPLPPGYLEHWNGTHWSLMPVPTGVRYLASAAPIPGSDEFWVGGASGLIMYYNPD